MTERSAKKTDGAYMLLRTMYLAEFIKQMINESKSSTLREMYYISEGWDMAKFGDQSESDKLAEDLEIITLSLREDFKLRPEESGASVLGNITLEEVTRDGNRKRFNCRDDVGDAGYTIPFNVEKDKLKILDHDADMIVAIETGGMYDRLIENRFDESNRAVLLHLKGQPARSTRRFLKRLNEESGLPVVVFTDGDPWSFRIFASVAYGAIKTAHISEYLATPSARYLGITPSDIVNYDLPSDKLSEQDVKALEAELTDPRFADDWWKGEIELQLSLQKKSEQQALAKYGLDFVTDTYLPEKLSEMGIL
jgi:DNA topoisomerase-6 subunit A